MGPEGEATGGPVERINISKKQARSDGVAGDLRAKARCEVSQKILGQSRLLHVTENPRARPVVTFHKIL